MTGLARALRASTAVAQFSTGLLLPVFPLYLMSRGLSLIGVAGVFAAIAVAAICVQIGARRASHLFARLDVVAPLMAVPALLTPVYLFVSTPGAFVALGAVSSLCGALASPGLQILTAQSVPPEERSRAYARIGAIGSLAYAAGVAIGGGLLVFGFVLVFLLGALGSLVGLAVTLAIARRAGRREAALRRSSDPEVRAQARAIVRWGRDLERSRVALMARVPVPPAIRRNARLLSLHAFLFGCCVAIYPVLFPLYLRSLGLPLPLVGVIVAASWIVYAAAMPWGARYVDRTRRFQLVAGVALAIGAALNVAMASLDLVGVIVAWILLGIADGVGRPVIDALTAASSTYSWRGEAFTLTAAAQSLARLVAPLSLAMLISATSFRIGFAAVAVVMALSLVPILYVVRLDAPDPARAPEAVPA